MKINMFQSIATIIAICFLLFGIISGSQAAEITSLSVYANPDYGSGTNLYPSLTADEDIMYIDWYVKQTFPKSDADDDYEHVHTSMHSHGTRSVYVTIPQSFDGQIKIAEYSIKAKVCFDNQIFVSATTTVDVYKPDWESGNKAKGEGNLFGHSEVTAHYFNGSAITMEGYCFVFNGTNEVVGITGRFKHTNNADPWNPKEKEFANTLKHTEFTSYSSSDWGSTFFDFDTTLKAGEVWDCSTYIRIEAAQGPFPKVDWFGGTNNITFDENDHR